MPHMAGRRDRRDDEVAIEFGDATHLKALIADGGSSAIRLLDAGRPSMRAARSLGRSTSRPQREPTDFDAVRAV